MDLMNRVFYQYLDLFVIDDILVYLKSEVDQAEKMARASQEL